MTAVTNDKKTPQADSESVIPRLVACPQGIADNVLAYAGTFAVFDTSNYIRPGRGGTSTDTAAGIFGNRYDNTITGHVAGGASLGPILVFAGTFGFANDTGAPILATTAPGTEVYILDNNTVTLTSSSNTKAGRLAYLDPGGLVFVTIYPQQPL